MKSKSKGNAERINRSVADSLGTESTQSIQKKHGDKTFVDNRAPSFAPIVQKQTWSTGKLDGYETDVTWGTDTLGGSTVGVEMTASPLGPDHPQGGPPKSGAQKSLMGKLETTPELSNENKYIRGHLLNDNLGGMGEDYNLYPITANANKEHSNKIEEVVKGWVNDDKQWVKYRVKVTGRDSKLSSSLPHKNKANSTFECKASVIDPSNDSEIKSISANIKSEYKSVHHADQEWENEDANLLVPGDEASLHSVLESTSKSAREYNFNEQLYARISKLKQFAFMESKEDLFDHIGKVAGIGATTMKNYRKIISDLDSNDNAPLEGITLSIKTAITKMNNHEEEILAAIDHYTDTATPDMDSISLEDGYAYLDELLKKYEEEVDDLYDDTLSFYKRLLNDDY